MAKILIVDDDTQINKLIARTLASSAYDINHAYTLAQTMQLLEEDAFDLIFLDLVLPDGNGLNTLSEIMGAPSSPEIVIITGSSDTNGASYALETGVFDYLQKPLNLKKLQLVCKRALEFRAYRKKDKEIKLLKRDGIIGKDAKLNHCLEEMAKAAGVDSNVLVTGETGTGKELIARAIHENSSRASNHMIVVDCAALKSTLMESILFGHEKGAFTGAESRQDGRVLMAHRGTLFLDEIGELDMDAQKRFLRILNDKRFYPLGAKSPVKSDFRLVSATNRDLETAIGNDEFRADLYYRISGQIIHLPPLRDRKADIRELVFFYVDQICQRMNLKAKKICPEVLDALVEYDWPGNIRELINNLDAAIANFPDDPLLQVRSLPAKLRIKIFHEQVQPEAAMGWAENKPGNLSCRTELPPWKQLRRQALSALEKEYFEELLTRTGGRPKAMAQLSGLSHPSIYALFKKYSPNS